MNKEIADQFLRQLAEPDGNEKKSPRVIMVRSNRQLKRFITESLNEVEQLVRLVKEDRPDWELITATLKRLSRLAVKSAQHNIDVAAKDISRLSAALLAYPDLRSNTVKKAFADFVTYLSTMLLRVYIEGSDQKCVWELASVEVLLAQAQDEVRRLKTDASKAHWVN